MASIATSWHSGHSITWHLTDCHYLTWLALPQFWSRVHCHYLTLRALPLDAACNATTYLTCLAATNEAACIATTWRCVHCHYLKWLALPFEAACIASTLSCVHWHYLDAACIATTGRCVRCHFWTLSALHLQPQQAAASMNLFCWCNTCNRACAAFFNHNTMCVVQFTCRALFLFWHFFLPLIQREYLADAQTYVFWRTEFYLANICISYWCVPFEQRLVYTVLRDTLT
jgi:hypothetical protein